VHSVELSEARSAAMQCPDRQVGVQDTKQTNEARRADMIPAGPLDLQQSFSNLYPRPYGRGYLMPALRASPIILKPVSTTLRSRLFNGGPSDLTNHFQTCIHDLTVAAI
jgi:hypothetical protein